MVQLRNILLHLYRWASWHRRSQIVSSFCERSDHPAAILFYHRVADKELNPWSMRSKNFIKQLEWVSTKFEFADLDTICATQRDGVRRRSMIHITFDDGYADNYFTAIPELVRRRIPTTYFVSTGFIESGKPFPHDLARGKTLRPNSIEQIRSMADQGIVIGAHSHSHVNFGLPLSRDQLRSEISDVRKKLQDWTGQGIDYFAFPYGLPENISQPAIDMIFESGYSCFLSAAGGFNFPGGDDHHLQRIHADTGMAAFQNWLTFDPRKTLRPSPIHYEWNSRRPEKLEVSSSPDCFVTSHSS